MWCRFVPSKLTMPSLLDVLTDGCFTQAGEFRRFPSISLPWFDLSIFRSSTSNGANAEWCCRVDGIRRTAQIFLLFQLSYIFGIVERTGVTCVVPTDFFEIQLVPLLCIHFISTPFAFGPPSNETLRHCMCRSDPQNLLYYFGHRLQVLRNKPLHQTCIRPFWTVTV